MARVATMTSWREPTDQPAGGLCVDVEQDQTITLTVPATHYGQGLDNTEIRVTLVRKDGRNARLRVQAPRDVAIRVR